MAGSRRKSAYPIPLDAVDEVRTGSSVCSEWFREECMRRCHEGRKPRRGRGPSGRAGRPRWQRGPFWTHMAGPGAWPSRRHPNRPREPGIRQSMSRRACCWDNACIGSFWGRMEEQMGDAAHLPPGGHGACRQARRLLQRSRGAGASRMADPHGACRKARCLAVCGDWGPPQNASGRISALVDMPIIPLGGIPCGREPASATLFIQRFPNRFPPCGQAREIWKRMSAKLRRLHGLDLLFEPAI